MLGFGSRGVPAEVARRAGLPRGQRVLASAVARDGAWLLGTRDALVLVCGPEDASPVGSAYRRITWEQIEAADWDSDESRLRVSEVGEYGLPRFTASFVVDEPTTLLQLLRERVTASLVIQRRVPVSGRRGFSVIGRRPPAGGPIAWMHEYDAGVDPKDPDVARLASDALAQARAEVGE
ncbi:MAG: hypothetical protein M3130_01745 [Actinomycetota bacterium]|nr:hypothetical protein [Actinomycetota bacterium]